MANYIEPSLWPNATDCHDGTSAHSLLKRLKSLIVNLVGMVGNQAALYPCVIGRILKPCISNPVQNSLILLCFLKLSKKRTPLCNSTLNSEILENVQTFALPMPPSSLQIAAYFVGWKGLKVIEEKFLLFGRTELHLFFCTLLVVDFLIRQPKKTFWSVASNSVVIVCNKNIIVRVHSRGESCV